MEKNTKSKVVVKSASSVDEVKLKVLPLFYYGTGRRKCAIAKVWIFAGTGKVSVNNKSLESHFKSSILLETVLKPLYKLNIQEKYDVKISTLGGGLVGQATAAQLGITKAVLVMNAEFRPVLKEEGFITRDPRVKERKKYGRKKARKGFQYRKR